MDEQDGFGRRVRRVKHPGCKWDYMPVFEGPENKGKSFMLATLFGDDYFTDQTLLGLRDKELAEAARQMVHRSRRACRHEGCRERKSKRRSRAQTDRTRPAYGRAVVEVKRTCVMAGTTNDPEYLRSQTGNRRFPPVPVKRIDLEGLRAARDDLWAEAVAVEAAGFSLAMPDDVFSAAQVQQARRTKQDPWRERLERIGLQEDGVIKVGGDVVYDRKTDDDGVVVERCTSAWLLNIILGISLERQNPELASRLRLVMSKLGWQWSATTIWLGGRSARGYIRKIDLVNL